MSYRDDLEAAQARAEAAERRAADLERRLASEADDAPTVAIPESFQITSTVYELTIRWRRPHAEAAGPLMIGALLVLCAPFMFFGHAESSTVYGLGLAAFGLPLLFWGVRLVVNRTTVSVVGDELAVWQGPLPPRRRHTMRIADVKQLFVRRMEREEQRTDFTLFALTDDDVEVKLVDNLAHESQAHYLERTFEGRLRIKDRPIAGEVTK